jgi:RNA polymerase sigma-70 factor, ECF subfamily
MAQETASKNDFRDEALLHLDALWQTALWFAENEQNAENIVTAAYSEAYRQADGYDSESNTKITLFKVLAKILFRNILPDFSREIPDNFENLLGPFSSNSIPAIKAIPGEAVNGAIRSLPKEIRMIMVLSNFEKFTYMEIADILGIHRTKVALQICQGYMLVQKELFSFFAASNEPFQLDNGG